MMNTMLISFGDGMMAGRIEWPIDGIWLALTLTVVFALLVMGLLRERKPESIEQKKRASFKPVLPKPLRQQQAV